MGYISDTARNRTHNLFRPKREPIPLGHSDVVCIGIYTGKSINNLEMCFNYQKNSKGFEDFCIRNIQQFAYGRREIEIAEQGE